MFRYGCAGDTICGDPGDEKRQPAGGGCGVRVVEHERGHYEVREVPYGKVYDWRPGRAVLKCGCGRSHVSSGSEVACPCGVVHAGVPERSGEAAEAPLRPWSEDYQEWRMVREAWDLRREYFVVEGDDD